MAMDGDTLVYNVGAIKELSDTLLRDINDFETAIDAMFKIIDTDMNQPDHWSGQTYEDLKGKCDNFRKTSIDNMISNLKAYATHFDTTSTLAEETTSQVRNTVTDDVMTNANITSQVTGNFDEIGFRS